MAKHSNKTDDGTKPLANKVHELFCRLYAGNRSGKIFGNATLSYLTAFGYAEEIDKNTERMVVLSEKGSAAWKKKDLEAHGKVKKEFGELESRNKSLRKTAASLGERLMRKVEINNRIDYLFDQYNEPVKMDREMAKVIAQDGDLMSKVAAYREVNKVRGRINEKLSGEFVVKWQDPDGEAETKRGRPAKRKAEKQAVGGGIEWGKP